MHERAREFAEAARDRYGFDPAVEEFDDGTRTAEDAAAAIGCQVAQIASSIVVTDGDRVAVVVTSGANRLDTVRVADELSWDGADLAAPGPSARRPAGPSAASRRSVTSATSRRCSTSRC